MSKGAHPFTLSSAWTGDGWMQFLIKDLGDYTRVLPATLKVGEPGQGGKGRMGSSISVAHAAMRSGWVAASASHLSWRA